MAKVRPWIAAAVIGVLAVVLGGWLLFIKPQQKHAADLRAQVQQQEQSNSALQSQIRTLRAQRTALPSEQARIAAIQRKLPPDPGLPAYVRFLANAAAATHVELVSVAPSPPQTVAPPTPGAGAVPNAAPTPSPTSTPASAPGNQSASNSGSGGANAGSTAVSTAQLQTISVKITVVGDYFAIQQFLVKIEHADRATLVTGITLNPGTPPTPGGTGVTVPNGGVGSGSWQTLQGDISAVIFMSSTPAPSISVSTVAPSPVATPTR